MKIARTDELEKLLRFAPDASSQTAGDRLTLTLLDVLQIVGEGRISPRPEDTQEARRIKRPARKSSGDPAGYWDLVQGPYWVTFNEEVRIPEGCSLILEPHRDLMKNGLWHPTLVIRDWSEVSGILLLVAARGVRMMENAPLSTGIIIKSKE